MTIYLVHGWWTRGESMDRLGLSLRSRGYRVRYLRYGKVFWRWRLIQRIFDALTGFLAHHSDWQDGDVIVAHSNGCNIAHKAMRLGLAPSQCVFLSPALDECIHTDDYSPDVGKVHVWYTRRDFAVWLARFVLNSDWGAMGRYGYRGSDPRFCNHDWTHIISGHSGWFRNVDALAQDIHQQLNGLHQPDDTHADV